MGHGDLATWHPLLLMELMQGNHSSLLWKRCPGEFAESLGCLSHSWTVNHCYCVDNWHSRRQNNLLQWLFLFLWKDFLMYLKAVICLRLFLVISDLSILIIWSSPAVLHVGKWYNQHLCGGCDSRESCVVKRHFPFILIVLCCYYCLKK